MTCSGSSHSKPTMEDCTDEPASSCSTMELFCMPNGRQADSGPSRSSPASQVLSSRKSLKRKQAESLLAAKYAGLDSRTHCVPRKMRKLEEGEGTIVAACTSPECRCRCEPSCRRAVVHH